MISRSSASGAWSSRIEHAPGREARIMAHHREETRLTAIPAPPAESDANLAEATHRRGWCAQMLMSMSGVHRIEVRELESGGLELLEVNEGDPRRRSASPSNQNARGARAGIDAEPHRATGAADHRGISGVSSGLMIRTQSDSGAPRAPPVFPQRTTDPLERSLGARGEPEGKTAANFPIHPGAMVARPSRPTSHARDSVSSRWPRPRRPSTRRTHVRAARRRVESAATRRVAAGSAEPRTDAAAASDRITVGDLSGGEHCRRSVRIGAVTDRT